MRLFVEGFEDGDSIPEIFTCRGKNRSPRIHWEGVPGETKSFAVAMDDPDAPNGTFTHWTVYNISSELDHLDPDLPHIERLSFGACQGVNDFGKVGYMGPCPPPGKPHTYIFHIYALNTSEIIKPGMGRTTLRRGFLPNLIEEAVYKGVFGR